MMKNYMISTNSTDITNNTATNQP